MKRALLVLLILVFALAAPAQAGEVHYTTVSPNLFGMHVNSLGRDGQMPDVPIGSVRLWDTGTTWRDVEVSRGVYDWTRLDTAVAAAEQAGATVMLVMSGTPTWYAKDPTAPSAYGDGFCSPTNDLGAWKNYVTAVAERYRGRITAYEPVNEGDILAFYCGNKWDDLRSMARVAYTAIKAVDPSATVTSPSFVDREAVNQSDIISYLTRGCRWADVISYHPYGMPNYGPELNARLVSSLRTKMHAIGCDKPVWSTEINYGLPFGNAKPPTSMVLTPWQQSAYVVRTFLMQWSVGVQRVYWYDWSRAGFLGVKMVNDDGTYAAPSRAFGTVRNWMTGQFGSATKSHGVWTVVIKYPHGYGLIKWNPNDYSRVRVPERVTDVRNIYGQHLVVGHYKTVGIAPVLFRVKGL